LSLESQLQTALLLAAPACLPGLRLFRRNIGEAKLRGGYTVSFGIAGQCDLYGYMRSGRVIEIELKAYRKKIVPGSAQDKWRSWCLEWGVQHTVLTGAKGETVDETVGRWCMELEALTGLDW
jgi:hypothetical protein